MRSLRVLGVIAVAALVLAACKIDTVWVGELPGGQSFDSPSFVTAHPDGGVLAVDCAYDATWYGAGLVWLREDGTVANPNLGCMAESSRSGNALSSPAVSPQGAVYVAHFDSFPPPGATVIQRVDMVTGAHTQHALVPQEFVATLAYSPSGKVFFGARESGADQTWQIYRVDPTGTTAIPGTEGLGRYPWAFDAAGNAIAAVSDGAQVVKVTPGGQRSVIAGTGTPGYSGDGGPATSAKVTAMGVDTDPQGGVFIADVGASRVRRVAPGGRITTVAGGGTVFPGDGGEATDAQLGHTTDVSANSAFDFYIATGRRVRHVGGS